MEQSDERNVEQNNSYIMSRDELWREAYNQEKKIVQSFIALFPRNSKWDLRELAQNLDTLKEFKILTEDINDENQLDGITFDILNFLAQCFQVKENQKKAESHSVVSSVKADNQNNDSETLPLTAETMKVNLSRFFFVAKEYENKLPTTEDLTGIAIQVIVKKLQFKDIQATSAMDLLTFAHNELQKEHPSDVHRLVGRCSKLILNYLLQGEIRHHPGYRQSEGMQRKKIETQVRDSIQNALTGVLKNLFPASPDTTPPSSVVPPQN